MNWALIICGGKGERLRPLTDDIPKPMVKVNNLPILYHQATWLMSQGINNIVFLTGYKGHVIREFFGEGIRHGFKAHYSHEDIPLGRGGAIKKGMSFLPEDVEDFVVLNGDNITTQNLNVMLNHHRESNRVASLLVTPYLSQYGVVQVNGGAIVDFHEKGELPGIYINAGVYIFNRRIHRMLPDEGDQEKTTFPHLALQKSLGAHVLDAREKWYTMDSVADVERVSEALRVSKQSK